MFNWFKKSPKKAKVLVVVNDDASVPVDYSNKVDVNLKVEVKAACESLAIPVMDTDIEKIVDALDKGESFWLRETWGFQIIEVEM